MTYKILFLDIDGTILKSDHTYTDSTKDAISQLQNKGIEVFLCTGRPLHEVKELAEELGVESYIGYNGAYAEYQNEAVIDEPMDKNTVENFIEIANSNSHQMVLYTSEKNYFTSKESPAVKNFIDIFQLIQNDLYTDEVAHHILGASVMNLNTEQAALYELSTNIHLSQVNVEGAQDCFDIIRKNVNKGEAVKSILKRLNISKEQAIAFGDGMNDKEMLQSVGEGFAMENGDPNLFAYARHKTTSVENSGIFNGLKQLGLVE